MRELADVVRAPTVSWTFALGGSEVGWLWQRNGAPPLDQLEPIRTPTASALNRHIAVTAYSITNDGTLPLESGLEHDLVRKLDRDMAVARIAAQPFRLSWRGGSPAKHTPDLLTVSTEGTVTAWDVRSPDQRDADFELKSKATLDACAEVGWRYAIFGGLQSVERLNLLWLHGFRRSPAWLERHQDQVLGIAQGGGSTLRHFMAADMGDGELKSTMWHLLWRGGLVIDLCEAWDLDTAVSLRRDGVP